MVENFSIDEIPETYYLNKIEQIKVLSDPVRYRMCLLLTTPKTCASLARSLKMTRPKAHYHLKKLESVELVRPYSQAVVNGIVEKYYVVAGRVLDFSHLIPKSGGNMPADLLPETVAALSGFLASAFDVSRENALAASESHAVGDAFFFDYEAVLTNEQFLQLKGKLVDIRKEIVGMTNDNLMGSQEGLDLTPYHLANYLSPQKVKKDEKD